MVALVLAVSLAVTSYWGWVPLGIASAVLVAALAYGWPRLTDSPQPRATSAMLLVFGVLGMTASWLAEGPPYLEWLPVLTGVGLLWAFVQNLMRGIEASNAVANVAAQVAGLVVTLSACSWVAAIKLPGDREIIVIGLISIILAQCAKALPFQARYTTALALALGVAGAQIGYLLIPSSDPRLVVILPYGFIMGGLVAALDQLMGLVAEAPFHAGSVHKVRRRDKARRWGVQISLGAAPIAMAGIAVYLMERIPGLLN